MATAQWIHSKPTVVRCSPEEIAAKIDDSITQFQAGSVIDRSYCVSDQWFRLILNPQGHQWDCQSYPGLSFFNQADKLRLFAQSDNPISEKIKTIFERRGLKLPINILNTYDNNFSEQQLALIRGNCQNCK